MSGKRIEYPEWVEICEAGNAIAKYVATLYPAVGIVVRKYVAGKVVEQKSFIPEDYIKWVRKTFHPACLIIGVTADIGPMIRAVYEKGKYQIIK